MQPGIAASNSLPLYLPTTCSPYFRAAALSYLLLADVALNFLCSLVLRKWSEQGQWSGSAAARALVERLAAAVDLTCQAHDQFLSARDPVVTLRVACGLWVLVVLGSYLRCASDSCEGSLQLPCVPPKHVYVGGLGWPGATSALDIKGGGTAGIEGSANLELNLGYVQEGTL